MSRHVDRDSQSPTTARADVAPPTPYVRLIAGNLYQISSASGIQCRRHNISLSMHGFAEADIAASRCLLSGPRTSESKKRLPRWAQTSFLHRSLKAVKMNNQAYYELYRRSRYYTDDRKAVMVTPG